MSLKGEDALMLAMGYTDESLKGAGALKGEKGEPGEDGFSPIVNMSKANGVTTIEITDKNGTQAKDIKDGVNGKDGETPIITIGGNGNWFINGVDSLVSAKGTKGDTGEGFSVTKNYSSIDEMVSDTEPAKDSEVVVVITGDVGNFYLRLENYIDPEGITNGYLPIGSASDISAIKGEKGEDGATPYIDPNTKHWFINNVDTGVIAEGQDGNTPYIGSNNHWFVEEVDTGIIAKGQDGRSITAITKDDENNIIVTFSDGTTENIGELNIDVQADFLTSDGFGNLRYHNGHFQYYNKETSLWIDTSATPENVYIIQMIPQSMEKMIGLYDIEKGVNKLKFKEPNDTILDNQVVCVVEKVVIRRKLDSAPTSETDGTLVLEIPRKDFGKYKNKWYEDTSFNPTLGETWYYKAFPISTTGFVNVSEENGTSILAKDYCLFGYKLDQNESDPSSMITYLEDYDNAKYESAYMDYASDSFNEGDWTKDNGAWFMDVKPCMLKYDGTVDYYLNPNDVTKKVDGTDSDVANADYEGNAMIEFPKVYWKIVDNGDNTANIYICSKKLDDDFVCWSHIDNNGNEIDYCYMPMYNGSNVSSRLRSLSGKTPINSQTATTEITYALANNLTDDVIWYTEVFSDRMFVNLLLLLIGKSTDTQTIFGTGNNNSYVSTSNTGVKNTGTMNTKGLFWGNQDNVSGVKVFGMEHWWGNQWRRIAGWINNKGTQKIKMTYGQTDGSTVDGYNTDGSGYITIGCTPSGTNGGYISKMLITDNCLIPTIASGSATTYYCDGLWFNNSQVDYASVGGTSSDASHVGALYSSLYIASSDAGWYIGAALSCKPLRKE